MSLLYKALNQASQQREKGAVASDAAAARPTGAVPLAERLMAQGFPEAQSRVRNMRIARLALFGLIGLSVIAIALAFLLPSALPPEQVAAPAPAQAPPAPPPETVAAAPTPVPAPEAEIPPAVEAEPDIAEPDIAAVADAVAEAMDAETAIAPPAAVAEPARIAASPQRQEVAPQQKKVRDGGLENFVDEQLQRENMAGLGAPIDLNAGSGAYGLPPRAPVEITNDTEMLRERYESAALMLERDQPEEALFIYDRLLRNNPKDRLSLLGRAAALQKLGRNQMALNAYEDVLAAFPGDEWALVNLLGLVSTQEPQRALLQLDRLQRLNPAIAVVPAQMGMIQMAQGNYEMAARHLEKAVALEPENAKYVFNLAVVYDKWGQTKAALRYYRQCLEMAAQNSDGQIPVETVRSRMAFLDVK